MNIIKGVMALLQFIRLFSKIRKNLESCPEEYLTEKRMKAWRFEFEKIGAALERGDTKNLPRIVKWVFGRTEVDNHIGRAFGWFFKSRKIQTADKVLDKPYRSH